MGSGKPVSGIRGLEFGMSDEDNSFIRGGGFCLGSDLAGLDCSFLQYAYNQRSFYIFLFVSWVFLC